MSILNVPSSFCKQDMSFRPENSSSVPLRADGTLLLVNLLPGYKERAESRRIPSSASAQGAGRSTAQRRPRLRNGAKWQFGGSRGEHPPGTGVSTVTGERAHLPSCPPKQNQPVSVHRNRPRLIFGPLGADPVGSRGSLCPCQCLRGTSREAAAAISARRPGLSRKPLSPGLSTDFVSCLWSELSLLKPTGAGATSTHRRARRPRPARERQRDPTHTW